MIKGLTRLMLALATVTLVTVPPAAAQEVAAEPLLPSFGIRPVTASVADPASFGYFVLSIKPGQKYKDQALVVNEGLTPVDLDLYVANAHTAVNGSASFRHRGSAVEGIASWIRLDQNGVVLEPGETSLVTFTIEVPPNAPPGEHVAGLVVQPAETGTPSVGPPDGNPEAGPQFSVEVVRRVGVAVVVSVPGERNVALDATDIRLDNQHESGAVFALSVRNTGNVMVDGHGTLIVRNKSGEELGSFEFDMATVLAGDEGLFYLDSLVYLADGRFQLDAIVEYGPVRGIEPLQVTSVNNGGVEVVDGQPERPEPLSSFETAAPIETLISVSETGRDGGGAEDHWVFLFATVALLMGGIWLFVWRRRTAKKGA